MGEEVIIDQPSNVVMIASNERTAVVPNESKLEKGFRAICLNGAIVVVGMCLVLVGIAVPDLQSRTSADADGITKIFIGRGLGFLIGCIASGNVLSQTNQACWVTFALAMLAVTMATVPSCTSLKFLLGTVFVQGAACGVVKTGCGLIWRRHSTHADFTWSRALYVSFGVGAFVAPLLLLPFAGIATDSSLRVSARYDEDSVVQSSTVPLRLAPVPVRKGLIAPNILARFYRRRRSPDKRDSYFQIGNDTVLGENVSSTIAGTEDTFKVGKSWSDHATVRGPPQEDLDGSSVPIQSWLSTEVPEVVSTNMSSESLSNLTSSWIGELTSGSSGSPPLSSAPPSASTVPAALLPKPSLVGGPTKPHLADGVLLNPNRKVADSSLFRDEIRQNINKDVPVLEPLAQSSTASPEQRQTLVASRGSTLVSSLSSVLNSAATPYPVSIKADITNSSVVSSPSISASSSDQKEVLLPQNPLPPGTERSSSGSLAPTEKSSSTQLPAVSTTKQVITDGLEISFITTTTPAGTVAPTSATPVQTAPSGTTPGTVVLRSTRPVQLASAGTRPGPVVPSSVKPSSTGASGTKSGAEVPSVAVSESGEDQAERQVLPKLWSTKYSYWLAALLVGLAATSFAFYWVLCPKIYQLGIAPAPDDLQTIDPSKVMMSCRAPAFLAAIAFHILYSGLEVSFAVAVTWFATVHLAWSWMLSVLLSASFWFPFVLCRFLVVAFYGCLRQSLMMFAGLLLCITIAGGALVMFQHGTSPELYASAAPIWILVAALGFGMAAVFPGGMGEIERFLPRHSELFQVLGSSVGEMALPPIIGVVMTTGSTIWLAYILLALLVFCFMVAVVIRAFAVRYGDGRPSSRGLRSLPALQHDDDLEDIPTDTNDETELLGKNVHSSPAGSPLNSTGNSGAQPTTHAAIQTLMKNISNIKKD